jgi:hypothetical protein
VVVRVDLSLRWRGFHHQAFFDNAAYPFLARVRNAVQGRCGYAQVVDVGRGLDFVLWAWAVEFGVELGIQHENLLSLVVMLLDIVLCCSTG